MTSRFITTPLAGLSWQRQTSKHRQHHASISVEVFQGAGIASVGMATVNDSTQVFADKYTTQLR
jgi:hypothetical protein